MAKWVKIEYSSNRNITVQGIEYVEVDDDATEEDVLRVWQDSVNSFMADTLAELVDEPGEEF